jgi:hypothetical protein
VINLFLYDNFVLSHHFPPKFLDLKLAYQWWKEDRHLVGYDATTGVKFGEYTFGDNMKEEATVRCLLQMFA